MGKKDKYADKKKATEEARAATQVVEPTPSTSATTVQQSAPFVSQNDLVPLRAASIDEAKKRFQGSKGKSCKLEVNLLPLNIKKLVKQAYHYDVSISPSRPKKFLPLALRKFLANAFPRVFYSFDSFTNESAEANIVRSNVYVNQRLNFPEEEFTQDVDVDGRNFSVTIKLAATIDMTGLQTSADQQAIQCLDIVIRSVFKDVLERGDAILAGKRIFFPNLAFDVNSRDRENYKKVKILPGLFQSAIACRSGIFLNLDITHKAFRMDVPVERYIQICLNGGWPQGTKDWDNVERQLKGISIDCKIVGTSKIQMHKFVKFGDPKTSFELEMQGQPKRTITVVKYYQEVKKYPLKYPELPLLCFKRRVQSANEDNKKKDKKEDPFLYFPIELCSITRQPVQCDIVAETAAPGPIRKGKIIEVGSNLQYENSRTIQGFGLEMNANFAKNFHSTVGRILDGPQLKYFNKNVQVINGQWNGEKFLKTGIISNNLKWAVLSTNNARLNDMITLAQTITTKANSQGMNFFKFQNNTDNVMNCNINEVGQKLRELKGKGFQLVFVIIDDRDKDQYSKVKRAAELETSNINIMTQCLKGSTFARMLKPDGRAMTQIVGNLLLKDNGKLNGTNYEIDEATFKRHRGTMYIGADVNHPGSKLKPSVVGISASDDLCGMNYNCIYKFQKPRQEMIDGFEEHIKVFVNRYKQKNGKYPDRIMYYRDGVSEGQFPTVLEAEWAAIKRGLSTIYSKLPPMTFICVQKRHHVRLFAIDHKDRNGNIVPGTIVDSDIVHPTFYQFYLASHAAIQGTPRPAKYCVLKDEINAPVDDLQAITHDLCHGFIRCTRAVSYPAPTYYSHLIAARAEAYMGSEFEIPEGLSEELVIAEVAKINKTLKISDVFINCTQMFFV